jgi:hypothetical protein
MEGGNHAAGALNALLVGATELTLVHERLDDLRDALPDIAEGVGPGWEMALDKLAALAEKAL